MLPLGGDLSSDRAPPRPPELGSVTDPQNIHKLVTNKPRNQQTVIGDTKKLFTSTSAMKGGAAGARAGHNVGAAASPQQRAWLCVRGVLRGPPSLEDQRNPRNSQTFGPGAASPVPAPSAASAPGTPTTERSLEDKVTQGTPVPSKVQERRLHSRLDHIPA